MAVETTGSVMPEELEGVLRIGDVVGGKLVVEGVLGVGGMGIVVSARHQQLGQMVAIKLLKPAAATHKESVSRFLREAQAAVNLQSAHVVRVMDVGTLEGGVPYMVMEHLTGSDLSALLEARGPLPVTEAVDYVLQGLEAVAEAHAIGLVHRDLKPANLFVTRMPDGSELVKVLDFGISKALQSGPGDPHLTATSAVLGSPMYMSPEQLRSSRTVNARTDLWAVGVILYELVSGRYPFEADTVTGLCARIAADPPAPLATHRRDLPPPFEAVVMHCLEKDVNRRVQTVAELAAALRPFASLEGQRGVERIARIGRPAPTSVPVRPASSGGTAFATGDALTATHTAGAQARRRGRAALLAISVGVLVLIGGLVAFRSGRASHEPLPRASLGTAPSTTLSVTPSTTLSVAPVQVAAPAAPSVSAASTPSAHDVASAAPPATSVERAPSHAPRAGAAGAQGKGGPAGSAKPADDLFLDRK